MKVGFIGLGTMGRNAAMNIRRAGFELTVHDLRREAANALIEAGSSWSESPADVLTRSDAVVTMVFGPKEVDQVVRGDRGFFFPWSARTSAGST